MIEMWNSRNDKVAFSVLIADSSANDGEALAVAKEKGLH
jgi:hypothetical protein